ncbi:antibiotic biosynthesis monooxygenase family protein [Marinobacter sp. F4218]|uniref:antibiotic biosynthesis monooxygenase family protein n=1 Tax=Marinobacter sp. F4218 TaxID=2862868 RepID=UPI001C62ADEA|nr:antibiotic biosynthesis monooxygenase [Marinobacter sp. F4218]MBW7470805.1 antibiotic biosynthesis monooxygenase [Marinobacter sp. F4218]
MRGCRHSDVAPDNFEAFKETWRATTNCIHETVPGALGSFMPRASESAEEILTLARWESLDSWRKFWQGQNKKQMEGMRQLGKRLSVECYEEVEDHTR